MKTRICEIILGIFFVHFAHLKAAVLPENISQYRTLNSCERSVLKDLRTKIDVLKIICYIETHSVFIQTPAQNTNDKVLREVANNFQTYWDFTFRDLLWKIPVITRGGIYTVDTRHPKALVLFWIIRKKIDLAFDGLPFLMKINILDFFSYHKTFSNITNKALKELKKIDNDPAYSETPDEIKLKEAYHRLEAEKGFLGYPVCIVQLLEADI